MRTQKAKNYLDGGELRKWAAHLRVLADDRATAGEERQHLLKLRKSALQLAKETDRREGK